MKIWKTSVLLLMLAVTGVSSSEGWPTEPFLAVQGRASLEVPPETATISLVVVAFEKSSDDAVARVQQQLSRVLAVFNRFEVPEDAITAYSLRKEVERKREAYRDLEILGYLVSRQVKIELSDLSGFSELIAALAELDNVSRINADFDVINRKELEMRLIRDAATDARQDAGNIAAAMGVSVGRVRAISESRLDFERIVFDIGDNVYDLDVAVPPYEDTVFFPSTISVNQSLHVIFDVEEQ